MDQRTKGVRDFMWGSSDFYFFNSSKLEVVTQLCRPRVFSYIYCREREVGDDGVMGYTTVPITS